MNNLVFTAWSAGSSHQFRRLLVMQPMLLILVLLAACGTDMGPRTGGPDADASTPVNSESKSGSTARAEAPAEPIPTAIVLDASGSMKADDAPGQRFAAAQKAFQGLLEEIPDGQATSLLTYGTGTGSSDSEITEGCQDVTTLIEAGPVDKQKYQETVDGLSPSGYTPIALALQRASEQLPESGKRAIILLSDGIDTCADEGESPDPCTVATDLSADGELAIHTVGFRVDGQTSKQLECLSEATQGTNWDAVNDKQLDSRLALTVNPQIAESTLTPDGYKNLVPGMSADEARQAGGFSNDISDSGRVEIIYVDCTLVFVDGVLTEIVSERIPTLDGIAPGDDISAAEAIYADPDLPTQITDDEAALYTADPIAGTGFKVYFEGAEDQQSGKPLKGKILKVAFCQCTTTDSYSVAAPPVGIFPGCEFQDQCEVIDAVQVQHPKQGALTLVMLNQDEGVDEFSAVGSIYAVDARGKVMDLQGNLAGSESGVGSDIATYAVGDQPLEQSFHFMRPITDRSGAVFLEMPTDDGSMSTSYEIDPDGYFTEPQYEIDWDAVFALGRGYEDQYYVQRWDGLDDQGYYQMTVGEGSAAVELRREGDRYVVD
ncbi:VWA domain-containing protein [Brevibacterium sp.]|uniref:vWA domain-containing protein n=1 Tax=Brevibacterium sp. TaxID=1701 RepID=UPI0028109FB2|nr:VWA domain-containing protein [Brevibacterium sp.]